MLGAEPLEILIEHFIKPARQKEYLKTVADSKLLTGSFQQFLADGVVFWLRRHELGCGRLVTLGDPFADTGEESCVDLVESLLASSAFLAVFRPRLLSDFDPYGRHIDQFIDGGVMDNLPI